MLARAAADFYWMGRYLERTEHTARLLEYQLTRLVDTPADQLALGWRVVYTTLGHPVPQVPTDADEAEVFLIADAYTLAGTLVEDVTNPNSMISCWSRARENARQLRPWLPVRVWTCLNRGFMWIRDCDFARAWAEGPAELALEAIDRLHLLVGVVDAMMSRDDAWRFMELGRLVERLQHQAVLLDTWVRAGQPSDGPRLSWSDLLRVCRAYELYRRRRSIQVRRESAIGFLVRNPELPRSLRFAVHRIEQLLSGIDPRGARYPLAAPHRMAIRLAASVEMDPGDEDQAPGGEPDSFSVLLRDSRQLHDLIMATYVNYPVERGLPS